MPHHARPLAERFQPTPSEVAVIVTARRAEPLADLDEWVRDRALLVACRICDAAPGAPCEHPAARAVVVRLGLVVSNALDTVAETAARSRSAAPPSLVALAALNRPDPGDSP